MRTSFLKAGLAAVALLAAQPALAQSAPSDGVSQYQVRIVDVPRAEVIEHLNEAVLDGETHSLPFDLVAGLLSPDHAWPVASFGGSTSRKVVVRDGDDGIDFKLSAQEDPEGGVLVGYVADIRKGDFIEEERGSGILSPGRVLVRVGEADDPEYARLTVLSIN